MKKAHAGMRISDVDWTVFMEHSAATLAHFEVPPREREDVLGFFSSLKGDVVEEA
jgi:hemoglobin